MPNLTVYVCSDFVHSFIFSKSSGRGRTASLYLKGSNGITDVLTITQDKKPLGDIDYLRMFYESANGDNWTKKWNFDAPLETNPTNWFGLKFENKRVVEIDIQSPNNIEGDIIPLCNLSELRSIKFKHQKLAGIPEEIGQLSQLTTLWIIESAASGNLPESLGECELLTSFNISNHPTSTPAGFNNTFTGNLDMFCAVSLHTLTVCPYIISSFRNLMQS